MLQQRPLSTKGEGCDSSHESFMQRALQLAAQGEGYTSPNPAVGAVVVREGCIVGEGYHRHAGAPHAEVEALIQAGEAARGAAMYVTLEPCNHHGRTPPCTEAITRAGIATVFYAVADPNPRVCGRGHQRLQEAGVAVHAGLCGEAAYYLNRFFFHHITTGQPYIIAKFAASLDGKIATRTGESRWITGTLARQQGHRLRHQCDAIAVGAGTALADNPSLTTRLPDLHRPQHPVRVLLDSRGRVPLGAHLFDPDLPGQTLVATTEAMPCLHRAALAGRGIEVVEMPATDTGQVDISALMQELGRRNLTSLLVEGGGTLLASFLGAGAVQEVWAFLAPLLIGGDAAPGPVRGLGSVALADALRLHNTQVEVIGDDILVRGQTQLPSTWAMPVTWQAAHSLEGE
ncbi:MAG: bifunctional diaminohydroxyphosphoribosylaminopyrimidine deaminase/5-amino-6-(5-phosphoribosylamino)uracil reductase RibD [Litorilinea sp.]